MRHPRKAVSLVITLIFIISTLSSCVSAGVNITGTQTETATGTGTQTTNTTTTVTNESGVGLTILYEQDESLINNYSLLAVNPDAPFADANGNPVSDVKINAVGANIFIDWMLNTNTENLIANYGHDAYGEYLFYLKDDAPVSTASIPLAIDETRTIRISTTTSVNDSGLLDYLVPIFENDYGYDVEIYSAGTGKAIENAKFGNADLILVHSKSQEEEFVSNGFSYVLEGYKAERLTFMYNYFVLAGPANDPAGCSSAASVADAFKRIADGKYSFISRGDLSGTHTKEVSLWNKDLGITTDASSVKDYNWYVYSNAGMGVCLTMANETGAYILTDKATFLTFNANGGVI
ncbi:MAG: substrate-binding domain-containing protein [Oscillospiraceae bacterium]